jgi:hypothetical protein
MLFTPSVGDTLVSDSFEGALAEAVGRMQVAERAALALDPDSPNLVSIEFDQENQTATITGAGLPVTRASVAGGGFSYSAGNYINTPNFVAATADLDSATLGGAVFELVQKIEAAEIAQPTVPGRLTSSINTSNNSYSFNITLDSVYTLSAVGGHVFSVSPYLV